MDEQRVNRWMGLLGIAILVLLGVGFGPLSGSPPGQDAAGARVVTYYNAHEVSSWAAIVVIGVGLVLVLVYVSRLRRLLLAAPVARAFLADVVYAAGILLVGGIVLAGTIQVALLLAAHTHQPAVAHTLNFLSDNDELGFLFGAALLAVATGVTILAGASLPKWIGVVSVVVGLASVAGPVSLPGLLAVGVWFPMLGFVIAANADRLSSQEPALPRGVGVEA